MPDFTPDTSFYPHQTQMDAGSMLGLVQRLRDLNTQSGISEAIRNNPDDPQAAYSEATRNPSVFMTPEKQSAFINTAENRFALNKRYVDEANVAASSLYHKSNASEDDWAPLAAALARKNIPPQVIMAAHDAIFPNGKFDKDRAAITLNQLGITPPMTTTTTAGKETTQTTGSTLFGGSPSNVSTPTPRPTSSTSAAAPAPAPAQDSTMQSANEVDRQYAGYGVGGGVQSQPSTAVKKKWADSANQYAAETASDYQADTTPYKRIIKLIQGGAQSGIGTTEINNAKNALHTIGILDDSHMKSVQSSEELRKFMAQAANTQSQLGTDARMLQASIGGPSPEKLTATNLDVARVQLGLRNMRQVATTEFAKTGRPPEYFSDWYNKWAPRQDTAAFVYDTLDDKEKKAFFDQEFKGKDRAKYNKFEASLSMARNSPGVTD